LQSPFSSPVVDSGRRIGFFLAPNPSPSLIFSFFTEPDARSCFEEAAGREMLRASPLQACVKGDFMKWIRFALWILAVAPLASVSAPSRAVESSNVASANWTVAAKMDGGRYAPGAARLKNGKVLIAGGYDGSKTVATALLFDPATGKLAPTGSLNVARNFPSMTLLDNGDVFVAGGYNSELGTLDTAELYHPETGSFRTLPNKMRARRELHTATLLPDGRVLLIGGYQTGKNGGTLASSEVYDPATQEFTSSGVMKAPNGRFGHAAILIPGFSQALVVGGKERSAKGWASLSGAETYDLKSGEFKSVGDMAFSRDRPAVAWVASAKKVLVIGGQKTDADGAGDVRESEWYDPAKGTFTTGPSLAQGRMAHAIATLPDGRILVTGGWSSALNRTVETAEIFAPDGTLRGGAFLPAGTMKASRHDHAAVVLADGRVLIAGGKRMEDGESYPADLEIFAVSKATAAAQNKSPIRRLRQKRQPIKGTVY
jgi:hypothetical protein